ncbi:MAG TPA: hypothetical protein VKB72_13265 [Steroidobacteraceae bacterium]|nr:hypothetical protein [Steroidobacteraceae bacterium]
MLIGIAAAVLLFGGPLLLGLAGVLSPHRPVRNKVRPAWDWQLMASAALWYAIAFNLTFLIQELFLALPKALLPGVHATLFHNNHTWEGTHPLTSLFQGTGVLATFASAGVCAHRLQRRPPVSRDLRLFLIWMIYDGLLMGLPQIANGTVNGASDVGMAMNYLGLGGNARVVIALIALAAVPVVALSLTPALLALADSPQRLAGGRARTLFISNIATVPALIGLLLIIPLRVPREWVEVLLPPVVVTAIGIPWIQAGAWRVHGVTPAVVAPLRPPVEPLLLLLGLLLVFQLLLRPGIRL